jgi:hypothetical protein
MPAGSWNTVEGRGRLRGRRPDVVESVWGGNEDEMTPHPYPRDPAAVPARTGADDLLTRAQKLAGR